MSSEAQLFSHQSEAAAVEDEERLHDVLESVHRFKVDFVSIRGLFRRSRRFELGPQAQRHFVQIIQTAHLEEKTLEMCDLVPATMVIRLHCVTVLLAD